MTLAVHAQDAQILAQRDLIGTARYVGLAGAMTAVGGDPSAVKDNPAGLGVYRRWDVSLSLFIDLDYVRQAGVNKSVGSDNRFSAAQASFIFGWVDKTRDQGMIANNLMFSYHNVASYDRHYVVSNTNDPNSLTDVIASKTNGVAETALQPSSRWDTQNWLSNQAYDTYLISPDTKDNTRWYSVLPYGEKVTKNQLTMREYGHIDQFAISWGGNISNYVFLGATLNVLSVDHTQSVQYHETFGDDCSLDNSTYVHQTGVGVNGVFGVIAHPLQWLRIGASFTTPSAVNLKTLHYGTMNSVLWAYDEKTGKDEKVSYTSITPDNSYSDRSWRMPMRVSAGLAFQVLNYGFLSVQYDLAHDKNIHDVHTLRAGIEGVITDQFFLECGYAYESTFLSSDLYNKAYTLPNNTTRTDAYSQLTKHSHYATAGFGYRGRNFLIHAAYRYRLQNTRTFAHELAAPYDLSATTHNIVLTLDFHSK